MHVWDVSSATKRGECEHADAVVAVSCVQPQGKPYPWLMYTASTDGTVGVWDPRDGNSVARFTGHTAPILSLAVSKYTLGIILVFTQHRNGNICLSSSDDKTVRVFALPS